MRRSTKRNTENKQEIKLTALERDIIEAGRNYKRSRPNGSEELRYYVESLIAEWLDPDD